jgi:two-component system, LytTR family, response regulator
MKALVVDDERLARARLLKLLQAHPQIVIVAEADSVDAAEAAVVAHAPEVIFLDIAMPGGSGFDLLARQRVEASVVFVTAYEEHALRAFEVNALDYLLKPVEPERLAATIARLGQRVAPGAGRICLSDGGRTRVVALTDILIVKAERDYTELRLKDGSSVLVKIPIARWEARLGSAFVRVHRSALVQVAEVARLDRAGAGSTSVAFLRGHSPPVPVSRSHAARVREALNRDRDSRAPWDKVPHGR